MNAADLDFLLTEIHNLAFVNPFGNERDRTEERIVSKLGWTEPSLERNPIFTKEFNHDSRQVR